MTNLKSYLRALLPSTVISSVLILAGCVESSNQTEKDESEDKVVVSKSKPVSSRPLSDSAGNANDNSDQDIYIVPNKKVEPSDLEELKDKTKKKAKKKDELKKDR